MAIGAPWENDGSGVVYIYRGSVNGLRSQYVQRIEAQGARSFGISISKGVDVDHNHCNGKLRDSSLCTSFVSFYFL